MMLHVEDYGTAAVAVMHSPEAMKFSARGNPGKAALVPTLDLAKMELIWMV